MKHLIDNYLEWLKNNIKLKKVGNGYSEISTPFLDSHNDEISIYIKKTSNGSYYLTDDGYTINDLEINGLDFFNKKSQHRVKLLSSALNGYGVSLKETTKELFIEANDINFPLKKHLFIQAILTINDMFMLTSSNVKGMFLEDVSNWLDDNDVRYNPRVKVAGKSKYDHVFDFMIPKSKKQPERIIKLINNPKKDSIESTIFSFVDTMDNRPDSNMSYALVNDEDKPKSQIKFAQDALAEYNINPLLWSQRQDYVEELAT